MADLIRGKVSTVQCLHDHGKGTKRGIEQRSRASFAMCFDILDAKGEDIKDPDDW